MPLSLPGGCGEEHEQRIERRTGVVPSARAFGEYVHQIEDVTETVTPTGECCREI